MRAKREGTGLGGGRPDYRLSTRSSSTGSSLLSDNSRSEPLSSCSPSEASRPPPLPGLGHNRNIAGGTDAHRSGCFQADGVVDFNAGAHFARSQPELRAGPRSKGGVGTDAEDTAAPDAGFRGTPQTHVSEGNENSVHLGREEEDSLWSSYDSDKKKSTTALNAVSVAVFTFSRVFVSSRRLSSLSLSLRCCQMSCLILTIPVLWPIYLALNRESS